MTRTTTWANTGLALTLVVVSPLSAESLSGYDDTTGDPLALLGGLLILGPLYGCAALLIREAACRFRLGWPGTLALAAAFGTVQAGVIDQSLFSTSYRAIPYWDAMLRPTFVEPLGFAPYMAMTFVGGHVIWSFCAPIALVGALDRRDRAPWLRPPGLAVTALLYLAAAALVLDDHLRNERDHAPPVQVLCALAMAAALAAGALASGRRAEAPRPDRWVPRPLAVGAATLAAAVAYHFLPPTWAGVAGGAALLTGGAAAVAFAARSARWNGRHVVAVAGGALLSMGIAAFPVTPLGDVDPVRKYAHNAVFLAGAAALVAWSARRSRPPARGDARP
ncbi:hypothetical protein ACSNOI_05475 [Actinomadura kijaniata]|uniref:hypothetical protein n=1 Tax=Actinomadura kijaniata TaxID=46161 RepID=UPI003F1BA07B